MANPNQSNETKKTIDSADQNIIKEKINQINNNKNKNKNTIKEKIALKSDHNPNKKESNKIKNAIGSNPNRIFFINQIFHTPNFFVLT